MDCCLKKRNLSIGNILPNFTMEALDINNKIITINNETFINKKVIYFFYPLNFTFVCPTELESLASIVKDLQECNTELLVISVDSVYSHQQWKPSLKNINFIMASDLNKNFGQKLGIINDEGIHQRATYLVDEKGMIQWIEMNPINVGRDAQNILRIAQAIHSGGRCPASWNIGDKFI